MLSMNPERPDEYRQHLPAQEMTISSAMEREIERVAEMKRGIIPYERISEGVATDEELVRGLSEISDEHFKRFAAAAERIAAPDHKIVSTRMDAVVALFLEAYGKENVLLYRSIFHRPVQSVHQHAVLLPLIGRVRDLLGERFLPVEEKRVILRRHIQETLASLPDFSERMLEWCTEEGLTELEKAETLSLLDAYITTDEHLQRLQGFWDWKFKEFDGEGPRTSHVGEAWYEEAVAGITDANLDQMYDSFRKRMIPLRGRVAQSPADRDPRWGRENVHQLLELAGIPARAEDVLSWAQENRIALEGALTSLGHQLVPGTTTWQEAWNRLSVTERSPEELLAWYTEEITRMVDRLQEVGLVPPVPPNGRWELAYATVERTRYFPKGFMTFPGYADKEKMVHVYLPHPASGEDVMRELAFDAGLFASHEVGAHAYQQWLKTKLPEFLTMVNVMYSLGYEGHAFSSEIEAFRAGALPQTSEGLFAMLRGRLQRAARAELALTYHLSRGLEQHREDAPEVIRRFTGMTDAAVLATLVDEYAINAGMSRETAQNDAFRGIENPWWLLCYYLGAGMAESYVQMAEKNALARPQAMRRWLERSGGLIPGHIQAYLEGWVDDWRDVPVLLPDPGITLWEEWKGEQRK